MKLRRTLIATAAVLAVVAALAYLNRLTHPAVLAGLVHRHQASARRQPAGAVDGRAGQRPTRRWPSGRPTSSSSWPTTSASTTSPPTAAAYAAARRADAGTSTRSPATACASTSGYAGSARVHAVARGADDRPLPVRASASSSRRRRARMGRGRGRALRRPPAARIRSIIDKDEGRPGQGLQRAGHAGLRSDVAELLKRARLPHHPHRQVAPRQHARDAAQQPGLRRER